MTVFTPIRPRLVWLSRLGYRIVNHLPWFVGTLRKLSFIHFAQWSFVNDLPFNGAPQRRERLRYTYLYFESNFNGTTEDYLDAFAYALPMRIRSTWSGSFGFPGPLPTEPFKKYVGDNDFKADHYYSAYPDASTTEILAALRLHKRWTAFQAESAELTAEQFAFAYRRLVRDVQGDL